MSDTVVLLGDFQFQDFEVPDVIPYGGAQMASVKKLPGGVKVVDAMGSDERPLEWSGRFRGSEATSRARQLDRIRRAGAAVPLSWGDLKFTVLVTAFLPNYEKAYEIPYSITCEVITNDAAPDVAADSNSVDDQVAADNSTAQALGATIGDGTLTGLLGGLDAAISNVSNFATAAQTTINSVLQPIAAVQGRVTTLIASAENTMLNVDTLGGVVPGGIGGSMASSLLSQVSAVGQAANLYDLQSVVGRMATNLTSVGQSGAVYSVAGSDLYTVASKVYGDASEWSTLAKANGLTDPIMSGVRDLLAPPTAAGAGGVLTP